MKIYIISFILLLNISCAHKNDESSDILIFKELSLSIPKYLKFIRTDTNYTEFKTPVAYKYYMNVDSVYIGDVDDFIRTYKHKDRLNVYVECSKFSNNEINQDVDSFKLRFVEGYNFNLLKESSTAKFAAAALTSDNEFVYLKQMFSDSVCYSIYYHAFNFGDSLDINYHLAESTRIMNSSRLISRTSEVCRECDERHKE